MIRFSTSRFFSSIQSLGQEQLKKRVRRLIKTEDLSKGLSAKSSSVFAACTAESYDLLAMAKQLNGLPSMIQNRDVLHFREDSEAHGSIVDCFYFRHGSFVVWKSSGSNKDIVDHFRHLALPFEKTCLPVEKQETEEIPFTYLKLIIDVLELMRKKRLELRAREKP